MASLAVGQVWQNGVTAVKIQEALKESSYFKLVIFDLDIKGNLKYNDVLELDEPKALDYLLNTKCTLTNKFLAIA